MVHNKFSQEKEQHIISEYLLGKSPKQISIELNTFNTSIRRVLLRNNIIPITSAQRWSNRENVFDNNSEESYYWLGFLIADGCVHDKTAVSLSSAEKDYLHLEKYAIFVKAPIKRVYNKVFNLFETRVIFRDKLINKYLVSLGVTPRKSLTIKLNIPLNEHILRGIFDGDGYARKTNGDMEIATGSLELMYQIGDYLSSNNIHYTTHKGAGKVNIIGIYSSKSCKKLYELFYTNATVFLERKKTVLSPFYSEN